VQQADELLQEGQVLGAGDGDDPLDQAAAALHARDEGVDADHGQRPAGALQRQQLVDLGGGELGGAVRVALDPGEQLRLGGLLEEAPQRLAAGR
jgi:hypothetical protein